MLMIFFNMLATIISVTSLMIVTYGASIGILAFIGNEIKKLETTKET